MDALPSPPASTQVLANTDLLHGIFTFVPLASANRNSHLDLAGCTTVCRTFHEPAIRVLWRNLNTLLPLWHLLAPSNVPYPFGHSYIGGSGGILLDYLQKVNSAQLYLDPKRWDRFLWHATHVRGIVHRSHSWETIHDADRLLTEAVITHNGGNTVLPLLRTTQWDCILGPSQYDALTPFFTSTLRHATFNFFTPSDEAAVVLAFRRLRESSPLLEKVVVYTGQVFDTGLLLMQELVCFSRLHQVQISRIRGFEALRVLVTKLNLTCLHVCQVTGPSVDLPADHATSVHSLRELSVGGDASVIFGLFNAVRFPALRSAIIRLNSCTRTQFVPTDLTTFLALFFNAVSGDLQNFEFAVYTLAFQSHGTGNEPFLRDLLSHILPIYGLHSFSLFTGSMVTIARIDDPDIQALAIAWPKLERLSIGSGFPSESSISIGAIHYLYTHCTDLKELSISLFRFPVIGVHEIPAPLADRSPSHPLRHLSMQNTIIMKESLPLLLPELSGDGSEAIARYLLDLFPSLDPQQYKRVMEYLKSRPRRQLPHVMHFDHRWNNVLRHIYSICSERGEL